MESRKLITKIIEINNMCSDIFVKEKYEDKFRIWRWDNYYIRVNCLTHSWDKSNFQKFYKTEEYNKMIINQPPTKNPGFTELDGNEKCWCGSGKKYKACHGRDAD